MKVKSLVLGFVVGGTVSAAATLLAAPSSGKELRTNLKTQTNEWKEMISQLAQDSVLLKDQIAETSKEGTALIKNLTKEMKKSVEEWKVAVEPHQENIHDYLEQIEVSLKELEDKVKQ
ncbi:MAG TPA: YtxH domain-containing protein [Bacillota bacterium]|nr:YtxH domain-containing protein [Bacillota bacterium]